MFFCVLGKHSSESTSNVFRAMDVSGSECYFKGCWNGNGWKLNKWHLKEWMFVTNSKAIQNVYGLMSCWTFFMAQNWIFNAKRSATWKKFPSTWFFIAQMGNQRRKKGNFLHLLNIEEQLNFKSISLFPRFFLEFRQQFAYLWLHCWQAKHSKW